MTAPTRSQPRDFPRSPRLAPVSPVSQSAVTREAETTAREASAVPPDVGASRVGDVSEQDRLAARSIVAAIEARRMADALDVLREVRKRGRIDDRHTFAYVAIRAEIAERMARCSWISDAIDRGYGIDKASSVWCSLDDATDAYLMEKADTEALYVGGPFGDEVES